MILAVESTPTVASQWETHLAATARQTLSDCQSLYRAVHLQPLLDRLEPGSAVLEAGCGLGQYVYTFASLGHHCTGLDFSAALLRDAAARGGELASLQPRIAWVHANILDLPQPDGALDCHASFGVLEHFTRPQQRQILAEAHRVLRPGGLLYLYVPNFWSPWTVRREMRYWYRRLIGPPLVWQRHLRTRTLRRLGRRAGFDEVYLRSVRADVALRSLALPSPLARCVPRPLRRAAATWAERAGRWCDRHNLFGYGLVYIGRKRGPVGTEDDSVGNALCGGR